MYADDADMRHALLLAACALIYLPNEQSKPDIQANAKGDNVWVVKPMDPSKRGQRVQFGDTIVLESAKWPGYYIRYAQVAWGLRTVRARYADVL